jgi:hypothetical protein
MGTRPLQRMGLRIDQQIPDSWIHPPVLVEPLQVAEEACGQIPVSRPPLHDRQLSLRSGVGERHRTGAIRRHNCFAATFLSRLVTCSK